MRSRCAARRSDRASRPTSTCRPASLPNSDSPPGTSPTANRPIHDRRHAGDPRPSSRSHRAPPPRPHLLPTQPRPSTPRHPPHALARTSLSVFTCPGVIRTLPFQHARSGTFSEPSRGFVGSSPSRSAFTSSTSSHASGNSCTGSGAPHGAEFREASLCASAASSHARPSVSVSSFGSDLTHAGLPDRPAIDSHRSRPCPDRPATDPSQSSRLAAPDVYACHPANPTQTGKVSGRSGTRSQVSPRASPHFATLPPPRLTKEESLTDQDILSFLEVGHTGLGLAQCVGGRLLTLDRLFF